MIDDLGKTVRTPKGQGHGTGHGSHGPIDVTTWAVDNPIVQGLPRKWRLQHDELWFTVREPAKNLTVLATGYPLANPGLQFEETPPGTPFFT